MKRFGAHVLALTLFGGCWVEAGNPPDKTGGDNTSGGSVKLKLSVTSFDDTEAESLIANIHSILMRIEGTSRTVTLTANEPKAIDLIGDAEEGLVGILEDASLPPLNYDRIDIFLDPAKPLVLKQAGKEEEIIRFGEKPILVFEGKFGFKDQVEGELVIGINWHKSLQSEEAKTKFEPVGEVHTRGEVSDLEVEVAVDIGEGTKVCLYRISGIGLWGKDKEAEEGKEKGKGRGEDQDHGNGDGNGNSNGNGEGNDKGDVEGKGEIEGEGEVKGKSDEASPDKNKGKPEWKEWGTFAKPEETVAKAPVVKTPECPKAFKEGKVQGGKVKWRFIPDGDYVMRTFKTDGTPIDKPLRQGE